MSDEQQGGAAAQTTAEQQAAAQQMYGNAGAFMTVPTAPKGPPPSQISFKEGKLDEASNKVDRQVGLVESLRAKSGAMGVPFPSFGVVGLGVAKAHDHAIERQSATLAQGRKALESWKEALKQADANYREADEAAGGGLGNIERKLEDRGRGTGFGGLPSAEMPGLPGADLPGADLPGADLPGADLPGADIPGTDLPGTDLPGADPPGTDLPGTDPSDTDLPGSDLPGADLPGADVPGADLPGTGLSDPGSSGVDDPSMKVPDIDSTLHPQQDPADMSSLDPRTQLSGLPDPNLADPGARSGTTLGSPAGGVGGSGSGSGVGTGLRPPGTALPGTMGSGMPMMPMMPMTGAGAGADDRDREEASLLSEDEGVWGGDEDIAPEIIGKET
jgi:hypothetical protein